MMVDTVVPSSDLAASIQSPDIVPTPYAAEGGRHPGNLTSTRSANELRRLIDPAGNHAAYTLDHRGMVTLWSEGAERIQGWTEAELLGRHVSVLYAHEEVAAGIPELDLARAGSTRCVEESGWRIRKDGSEFLAGATTIAIRNGQGDLLGFDVLLRDVTDESAAKLASGKPKETV